MHIAGTQTAVAMRQAPVAKARGGTRQMTSGTAIQAATTGVMTQSITAI